MSSVAERLDWVATSVQVAPPTKPASIMFPDTDLGRGEALRLLGKSDWRDASYCKDFVPDYWNGAVCEYRDPRHMDGFNKCKSCVAGFFYDSALGRLEQDW